MATVEAQLDTDKIERRELEMAVRVREYVNSRYDTLKELMEVKFEAQELLARAIYETGQEAIKKQLHSQDEKNSSMNEFRGQLKDQAATFITRTEAEAGIISVERRLEDHVTYADKRTTEDKKAIETRVADNMKAIEMRLTEDKKTLEARIMELDKKFSGTYPTLAELSQGRSYSKGNNAMLAAVIAGMGTLIGLVIAAAGLIIAYNK